MVDHAGKFPANNGAASFLTHGPSVLTPRARAITHQLLCARHSGTNVIVRRGYLEPPDGNRQRIRTGPVQAGGH